MIRFIFFILITLEIYSTILQKFIGGFIDDFIIILLFIFLFFIVINQKKIIINKNIISILFLFILYITVNLILSLSINYDIFYFPSFFYEFFKLSAILLMIPLAFLPEKIYLNIFKGLVDIFIVFAIVNIIVLIMQKIFGNSIIVSFVEIATKSDRDGTTGLIFNKNGTSDCALAVFLYSLFLKKKYLLFEKFDIYISKKKIKVLKYLSLIIIFLSTSKHAFLILMLIVIVYNFHRKKLLFLLSTIFVLLINIAIIFDVYRSNEKFTQYYLTIKNLNKIQIEMLASTVELRGVNIIYSIIIFKDNFPFGIGMGTWGDASSSFNYDAREKLAFKYTDMSDSHFFHLLAEQGILSLIYYFIFFYIIRNSNKEGYSLFTLFIVTDFITMGISGAIFPALISINIATILSFENIEKKITLEKNNYKLLKNE